MAAVTAPGGVHSTVAGSELQDSAWCHTGDLGGSGGHRHRETRSPEEDPARHQTCQGYHQRKVESGRKRLSTAGTFQTIPW